MKVELFVELLIPDTTAITAFHTLERMGYKIKSLKRQDYYVFDVEDDVDNFMKDISKVDILVNANKHKFVVHKGKEEFDRGKDEAIILVKNSDGGSGVLSTLKERLGFSNITSMESGTLWKLKGTDKAKEIAENLLMNKHYQDYEIK